MDYSAAEQRVMAHMMSTKVINGVPMMSHLQITELTDKRQDWVKSVMDELRKEGLIPTLTEILEVNHKNQRVKVYYVNERDSHVVVARLSPEYMAFLVDFWMANRDKPMAQLPDFSDRVAAARAWADAMEKADAEKLRADSEQLRADKAVKEKAWIEDKARASAMGTASAAKKETKKVVKENEKLKEQLAINGTYLTARAIPWLKDFFRLRTNSEWAAIGKELRFISQYRNYDMPKVADSRWRNGVNSYHKDIIGIFHRSLINDGRYMEKFRK